MEGSGGSYSEDEGRPNGLNNTRFRFFREFHLVYR